MKKLAAWLQASRLLAQANIAVPLIFGQALAYGAGSGFRWSCFAAAMLFGVADQLFIVYANDAADWESDAKNDAFTLFSGGSRVVPEGKLTPRELFAGAGLAFVCMILVSAWAWRGLDRPGLFVATGLAALLLWAYSFRPLRLSYRGGGEWLQAVGVGVVLPATGFYLQSGTLASLPWLALAASFVLGWAGNVTTAIPDTPSDRATGKVTFPVRRGEAAARRASLAAIAVAALATPMVLPGASPGVLVAVAAAPLVCVVANVSGGSRRSPVLFVALSGAAITAALLGWSIALYWF